MPDEESLSAATTLSGHDSPAESPDGSIPMDGLPRPQGYAKLAKQMADYPAHLIFRQFGELRALNMLFYQAELTQLESDFRKAAKLDQDSTDPERQLYFRCYERLSQGKIKGGNLAPEDMVQWNIFLEIRKVLKEASEAFILEHTIRAMARPEKRSLQTLRRWITHIDKKAYVHLSGDDNFVWWNNELLSDLVALYAREYEDPISEWITNRAQNWYNQISNFLKTHKSTKTWMPALTMYSRKTLLRIVTGLAIGIASLMPILSIVILNAIRSTNMRLGVMALFTVLFCLLFGIFTGPKKTELLAASAAFAAVQVVFITGDNKSNPP